MLSARSEHGGRNTTSAGFHSPKGDNQVARVTSALDVRYDVQQLDTPQKGHSGSFGRLGHYIALQCALLPTFEDYQTAAVQVVTRKACASVPFESAASHIEALHSSSY